MEGLIVFAVSAVVVFATSLFKNVDMSSRIKNVIATVLSTVGGITTALGTNGWDFSGFDGGDVLANVLIIYGAAQALYQFILKGTEVDAKLEETHVLPTGGGEV
jgi:hypothetical protein